jgi:hypothetical protein
MLNCINAVVLRNDSTSKIIKSLILFIVKKKNTHTKILQILHNLNPEYEKMHDII